MVENKLSGDAVKDSEIILGALKNGAAFIANDRIKTGRGFRFNLNANGNSYTMGDEVDFKKGMILTADLPAEAECILLKDGMPVFTTKNAGRYPSLSKPLVVTESNVTAVIYLKGGAGYSATQFISANSQPFITATGRSFATLLTNPAPTADSITKSIFL